MFPGEGPRRERKIEYRFREERPAGRPRGQSLRGAEPGLKDRKGESQRPGWGLKDEHREVATSHGKGHDVAGWKDSWLGSGREEYSGPFIHSQPLVWGGVWSPVRLGDRVPKEP